MRNIVYTLFPTHLERTEKVEDELLNGIPLFNEDELSKRRTPYKIGNRIPVEALKIVARVCPDLLLNMYNRLRPDNNFGIQIDMYADHGC